MKTLTVGIVQYNCGIPDQKLNTDIGLRYVREAKALGTDIVLFPECWITAYAFPDIVETKLPASTIESHPDFKAWYGAALDDNSAPIQAFQAIAQELSVGIVITGFTKGRTRPQNSAFVIDRNGEILLKYSKVHTCDFDTERILEPGTEFKVCEGDHDLLRQGVSGKRQNAHVKRCGNHSDSERLRYDEATVAGAFDPGLREHGRHCHGQSPRQ